jgi:2-keto-3-deoxy-L-rhamnonate aldolase RhmA
VGIFARLTTPESYEVLTLANLDVLVLDIEHGSFDRASLGRCIFAARAGGLPTLARMADHDLSAIQHAIGAGADGIIVPHTASADEIRRVATFARGLGIERAHAGATRSACFRETPWDAFRDASKRLIVIAQIDEPAGVAAADEIAQVNGIDGAFLGRIGLRLAMDGDEAAVDLALERVCAAFRKCGLLVGMSLPDQRRAKHWLARGVGLFVIDGNQRLLLNATRSRALDYRAALSSRE